VDAKGTHHKGRLIEKEPKTQSSIRCISVDSGVIGLLVEYEKWWMEQRTLNGDRWVETDKLFIKEDGGVMHPDSITDFTSKFREANDLPHFSPHSLRHTNISLMIAAGVDIKTVSSRAGHANVTTTGNIYTHQIQSANARAAEKLGDILSFPHSEKPSKPSASKGIKGQIKDKTIILMRPDSQYKTLQAFTLQGFIFLRRNAIPLVYALACNRE
jgi:hypothetical protein